MKPGDHPEFFRLPPPPGTSRESTIVLDAQGRFFHDGAPVEKRSLSDAMHRWLSKHPDDGRDILTNGYDWCYLTVEDTSAFVASVRGAPPDRPILVLANGAEGPLDPASLVQNHEGACFGRIEGSAELARFQRHAQTALMPWLADADPVRIEVCGERHAVGNRSQNEKIGHGHGHGHGHEPGIG